MLTSVPPHSHDAEQWLLGCLLIDPQLRPSDVAEVVDAADWYDQRHAMLWDACEALEEAGDPVDIAGLRARLGEKLDGNYLAELMETPTTSGTWRHHAEIIRAHAQLRRLWELGGRMQEEGRKTQNYEVADKLLDEFEQNLFDLRRVRSSSVEEVKAVLARVMADIEKRAAAPGIAGVTTGFHHMDEILGGFKKGQLIVLGARPAVGKSTLGMNIGLNQSEGRTLFMSLEMTVDELILNAACCVAAVDCTRAQRATITSAERDRLTSEETMRHVDRLVILDPPSASEKSVRAMCRRLVAQQERDIRLIVVDYLQLMCEEEYAAVTAASKAMKQMARALQVPVILLSQLSRKVEHREDGIPTLADLRMSGGIEADADKVILLHGKKTGVDAIVAKNRGGRCGTATLTFNKEQVRFET